MKKSELPIEHIEKISLAVEKGLSENDWELISILSGGLTGVPVYKIEVDKKYYAIKLEDVNDKRFDLFRNYQIIEMVSKQGISPFVYFANAERGIILMDHVEVKPRPEASPESIKKIADVIRNLHEKNAFPNWKSVTEILNDIYQTFPENYRQNNIIKKCVQEVKMMENILFDEADIRSCHCDLNPVNILFDGNNYFFVDWQAASSQSFYFDLAYSASWFYFYNEVLCASFLNAYLEREANEKEKAKYYLMRVFTNIYLGIGFISLPLKSDNNTQILSDENIKKLPTFIEFMQSIGSGRVNLADPNIQQQFGFVFLKNAEKMMDQKYQSYYKLLQERN
jgi:thiamine kinase-like enzyme